MRTEIFHSLPEKARDIRICVFMEEQGFKQEFDALDEVCVHLVAFDDDTPVATCRIWEQDEVWHVGRLAVIKSHRKKGLGAQMLAAAEKYVRTLGGKTISLHAQRRAESFYRKSGYIPFGETDYDEGVEHVHMQKDLT